MKANSVSERGQVLVLIALAIIGLVGITGVAIDGSMVLADRRHAQNAADTSALAGALAYINACQAFDECDNSGEISSAEAAMVTAAGNRAIDNGYTGDLISSTIEINRPPVSGAYAGNSKYLQVIIYSTVPTTFARVLGVTELNNRVEAVALLQEESWDGIFGENALVSLKPTSSNCSGDFTFGGSALVTIEGGGVYVNSNNSTCAFQCGGGTNGILNIIGDAGISIVGDPGYRLDGCTAGAVNAGDITSGADPYPFPPELVLAEPPECTITPPTPTASGTTLTLYPGSYNTLPPTGGNFMGFNMNNFTTIILESGNYCVSSVLKDLGNNTLMSGTEVFIFIKQGGNFDINGGAVQITAPKGLTDPYKGYLIYVDPGPVDPITGTYSGNPANCKITGNSSPPHHEFTGAIYTPYCNVSINGDTGPQGIRAQIISYQLKLNGNNSLYILYNKDDMPQEYTPPATGVAQ